jgi:hypothetical protein
MISLNQQPPAMVTNEALSQAMALIALARNPDSIEARINEYVSQTQAIHAAIAEHDAAKKSAEAEVEKLSDLVAAQAKLAADQAAMTEAHAQLAVATSAVSGREQAAGAWEAKLTKRESEIAAKEAALAAKLASYRQALA